MCESDVCRMETYHWNTLFALFNNGFLDHLTCLVYLIIVPYGLFVSRVHCLPVHLYHLYLIPYLFKLLKHIHMVSLITVLNGNVWQFTLISIFSILAHLIYLLIELDESIINLSVLIHLVCLITEPNGFISSDNLFSIGLSVHSLLVCFITLLDVIYVQIDNWVNETIDHSFNFTSNILIIIMVAINQFFYHG